MAKISKGEYELLKSLDDQWRWIARDSKVDNVGNLFAYLEKTFKRYDVGEWDWDWDCGRGISSIDNHLFQFIQWEDEFPHEISELIREYEWQQSNKERPPTKEEKEKVKVPKFVNDWLKNIKENNYGVLGEISHLEDSLTSQNMRKEHELYFWLKKNFDAFAKAWLDYPNIEVEEEQKYYVILEENSYGAMGLGIDSEGSLTFTATHDKWSLPKLTEREIKDYDERFWPFVVKVEEWEND